MTEKVSDRSKREEKVRAVKAKILKEIKAVKDTTISYLKIYINVLSKENKSLFYQLVYTLDALQSLEKYISEESAFMSLISTDSETDKVIYNISDFFLNIFLQSDYNFAEEYMSCLHQNHYTLDFFAILNDEFFGFDFVPITTELIYRKRFSRKNLATV